MDYEPYKITNAETERYRNAHRLLLQAEQALHAARAEIKLLDTQADPHVTFIQSDADSLFNLIVSLRWRLREVNGQKVL